MRIRNKVAYGLILLFMVEVIVFGNSNTVKAKIYDGEKQMITTLVGKVVEHGTTAPNGSPMTQYDLLLDKKIKFTSEMWGGSSMESRIMINSNSLSTNMSKLVGKKVQVTGVFMGAASGYYCEKYAIFANCIENISNRKYYSVAKIGIGHYNAGKKGAYYEKYYTITKISGNIVTYKRVIDGASEKYSKVYKAKIKSSTKYYAIDMNRYGADIGVSASKNNTRYIYQISRKKALNIAKKSDKMLWLKMESGKISALVINAEQTAG